MTSSLITAEYVAASTGADVAGDPKRVGFLILEASTMVMEYLGRPYTPENAPVAVKQAVAVMVSSVLADKDTTAPDIKAESIGDYRVEFQAGGFTSGLDIRQVAYLLAPLRSGARAVKTNVAQDGLASGTYLVVNR